MLEKILSSKVLIIFNMLLLSSMIFFVPIVSTIMVLSLSSFVGLRYGWVESLSTSLISLLTIFAVTNIINASESLFSPAFWMHLALFAHVVCLAYVFRLSNSVSMVLRSSVLLGLIAFLVSYFLIDEILADFWQSTISKLFNSLYSAEPTLQTPADLAKKIDFFVSKASSNLIYSILVLSITAVFIARFWQSLLHKPKAFGEEFRNIRLGVMFSIIGLAVILISTVMPNNFKLLDDISKIFAILFAFQGLSVIMFLSESNTWSKIIMVGLGIFIGILFTPIVYVIIMVTGVSDNWVDYRESFGKKS